MQLTFLPLELDHARQILSWRYPPPYDVYNPNPAEHEVELRYLVDPANRIFAMLNEAGEMLAYCSYGSDARVPGGDYAEPALDLGLGVRPDLTGHGQGSQFVQAFLDYTRRHVAPPPYRVTIAEFNQRARRVWEKAGFRFVTRFTNTPAPGQPRPFVILIFDE